MQNHFFIDKQFQYESGRIPKHKLQAYQAEHNSRYQKSQLAKPEPEDTSWRRNLGNHHDREKSSRILLDNDTPPVMGFIYEEMDQAKENIQKAFKGVKKSYLPLWKIIDERWDRQLHRPLHAAGYFLNPRLHYSPKFKYNENEIEEIEDDDDLVELDQHQVGEDVGGDCGSSQDVVGMANLDEDDEDGVAFCSFVSEALFLNKLTRNSHHNATITEDISVPEYVARTIPNPGK
ncbi:hypothetical protein VNO77_04278 [Canavalia gladiata]|uniref:Uncharacterized protein n=1 Tax=Canavalia gladiata TaxID=3824 RepID=A0AAN9MWB5_CANGL